MSNVEVIGAQDKLSQIPLRANLFGFAILELDLVRPFSRPERGMLVQFGFTPGF